MSSTTIQSFIKYLKNGEGLYMLLAKFGLKNHDVDEKYLQHVFKAHMGECLRLDNPITFNEKVQWLKINYRNPSFTKMVDKYEAKCYVERLIGKEYIIPTYGIWEHFDEINFDQLPDSFVLKCTHDSNSVVICRDKSKSDKSRAGKLLESRLKYNHFYRGREWAYKDVPPRIIAEMLLEDKKTPFLTDYKLFCFNGVPKLIMTARGSRDNENEMVRRMYDTEWNILDIGMHGKPAVLDAEPKPQNLEKMIRISAQLSQNIPLLRVDLYEVTGRLYFGELTLYHSCGFEEFVPKEWDKKLGEMINLGEI